MPVCDILRWLVPMPILVDAPGMSMLYPLFTMLDGSMFSFLFWCITDVFPWLDPLLQIPFSIYFFCAMPELILLMILLTPLPLCRFEDVGMPDPDLLVRSFADFLPPFIILCFDSSAVSPIFGYD